MLASSDVWDRYDSINGAGNNINIGIIIMVASAVLMLLVIILLIRSIRKHRIIPEDRLLTADSIDEMPLDSFLDITDEQYRLANDLGCYILYNIDKGKYYVGKAPLCADAVNRQIIGKGAPDIFYENKNGDEFTVQFYFVCEGSAYHDAQELYDDIVSVYSENSEVVGI